MESKDIFFAAASLAVVLLILLLGVVAAIFLFTLGSPLLLLGGLVGLGALGLVALFGILVAIIGAWYIVYAFLKQQLGAKEEAPQKGDYTIERIKRSE